MCIRDRPWLKKRAQDRREGGSYQSPPTGWDLEGSQRSRSVGPSRLGDPDEQVDGPSQQVLPGRGAGPHARVRVLSLSG
eukprot:13823309-Alexandrium_andersonii.AAC.1